MLTPKLGKGLGRKSDRKDERDFIYEGIDRSLQGATRGEHTDFITPPLPSHTDVFAGLNLPVYDQGALGSCTSNAGVLYRRFLAQKFSKYSAPDEDLSRLFLYYQERKLPWNNDVATDGGAAIRDICYVLAHTGVCRSQDDEYDPAEFASADWNDSNSDHIDAAKYKIGAYHRIPGVATAMQCLASGYAVLLGCTVYAGLEEVGSDGVLKMPQPGEQPLGGHALVIRGYDDHLQCFMVQNSWGAEWGDAGSFWMPYDYLTQVEISNPDMWMAHLGKPWKAVPMHPISSMPLP